MENYYTIEKESCILITEKRSKFIAQSFTVNDEYEAAEKLNAVRKNYSDATHVCYAYILKNGCTKNSDDKEPPKTAGYPILEALKGRGLYDVMVTVTRYFGGVKLGTGGLARAYGSAAAAVLDVSGVVNYVYSVKYTVTTHFANAPSVEKAVMVHGAVIKKSYDQFAVITAVCPTGMFSQVQGSINGITSGNADIAVTENIYYPYKNS